MFSLKNSVTVLSLLITMIWSQLPIFFNVMFLLFPGEYGWTSFPGVAGPPFPALPCCGGDEHEAVREKRHAVHRRRTCKGVASHLHRDVLLEEDHVLTSVGEGDRTMTLWWDGGRGRGQV